MTTPVTPSSFRDYGRILVALAIGCAIAYYFWSDRELRGKQTNAQKAQAAATLAAGPVVIRQTSVQHQGIAQGVLTELRVPFDEFGTGLIEQQTCYVWRDIQTNTSSLSCPRPASLDLRTESGS